MQGLTHQSCVQELKSKVEELTGIPCDVQKIMVGYPPSSLDLRNGDAHLKDYPIKSGMLSNFDYTDITWTIFTPFIVDIILLLSCCNMQNFPKKQCIGSYKNNPS